MNGDWGFSPSVRELRRRWKPHKERLLAAGGEQPTSIRFHRACSWLARVESLPVGDDQDWALVSLWIALNALYGQWDPLRREPRPDRESWRAFVDRILKLDRCRIVSSALEEHKRLVMALLEDQYLSGFFWQAPSAQRAGQAKNAVHKARDWYLEKCWTRVLDEVLDRVYLLRCQLVHGAATYGGKLNRTSLRLGVLTMQRLLPAFLLVWIDHGAQEDWGPMCYPPVGSLAPSPR